MKLIYAVFDSVIKTQAFRASLVMWTSLALVVGSSGVTETKPVRSTVYGQVQGVVHSLLDGRTVERYLGVPYATPPTGERRFQPPAPPTPWSGVRQANKESVACMQYTLDVKYIREYNPDYDGAMNEDCLYLNVYVPVRNFSSPSALPVLVHIHGGSNEVGMGAMLHGDVLASYGDMVVVTFNYRLGAFGFLRVPQIDIAGNFGLQDQVLAMTWVQENIANFGADPSKVTIQGHSAGSIDASLHVLSPMSKGLFRYAILQSGAPTASWAILPENSPEETSKGALHHVIHLGCYHQDKKRSLACLRSINATTISTIIYYHADGFFYFSAAVDGKFLLDHPEKLMADLSQGTKGPINALSIMMGVVKDEGSLTAEVILKMERKQCRENVNRTAEIFDNKLLQTYLATIINMHSQVEYFAELTHFVYKPWSDPNNVTADCIALSDLYGDIVFTASTIQTADYLSAINGTDVYMYSFEHRSRESRFPVWMGVPHGEDLYYLFGSPIEGHPLRNYTDLDKKVSLAMIDIWANFVTHGRPSLSDQKSSLRPYREDKSYIYIGSNGTGVNISNKRRLRAVYVAYWNNLLNFIKSRSEVVTGIPHREMVMWIVVAFLIFALVVNVAVIMCLCCKGRSQKLLLQQSNSQECGVFLS